MAHSNKIKKLLFREMAKKSLYLLFCWWKSFYPCSVILNFSAVLFMSLIWTQFPGASCLIWGDSYVSTFDGRQYNFDGTCTYQAVGWVESLLCRELIIIHTISSEVKLFTRKLHTSFSERKFHYTPFVLHPECHEWSANVHLRLRFSLVHAAT